MYDPVAALRTLVLPYGQPANSPQVIINEDPVRTELQTLYSNRVIADFIYQKDRNDYVYQALVSPVVGKPFLGFGGEESVSLTVTEAFRVIPGSLTTSSQFALTGDGRFSSRSITFDGTVSLERGVPTVFAGASLGPSNGAGNGVGTTVGPFNTWAGGVNTHVFERGRVYRLLPNWFVSNNGGWTAIIVQVRSAGGTVLANWELTVPDNGHLDVNLGAPQYVYNNTAADITCRIDAFLIRRACQVAGANVFLDAGSIEIADIGATAQYASLAFGTFAVA